MASNAFLVFSKPAKAGGGTISPQGETQDATFKSLNGIEISSFTFGLDNPTTIGSVSAGAGAGKAKLQQLTIKKTVDNASPQLLLACGLGAHFPQVDLYIRKAGSGTKGGTMGSYLVYNFAMVFVTDVTWSNGDEAPEEEVTLVYGALQMAYYPQSASGQLAAKPTMAQWSQVTNQPTFTIPNNG